MIKRKTKIILLAFCLLSVLCAGCTKNGTDQRAKGKLVMYWGANEDFMVKHIAAFTKETGIKVEAVRMSSGEIIGRLQAEKNNPRASVWFGGSIDGHIQAKKDGLLAPYVSHNAAVIPAKFKDPEGYWTGVYVGYLGFASNAKLLKERNLQAPTSWNDLLNPALKGQIICANPGSSGTAYAVLATMVQLLGEKEGLAYMNKLDKQIKSYQKSGPAAASFAGQGECIVGITYLHDGIQFREEGMKDLVLTAPKEGTGYEIGGVSLIKGGPDAENAKKFIDWCLTKRAQELGQQAGAYQFLTNPQAQPPAIASEIADTKLINYNFVWAGENRNRLVNLWHQAIKDNQE